jgi:hypothetical protein
VIIVQSLADEREFEPVVPGVLWQDWRNILPTVSHDTSAAEDIMSEILAAPENTPAFKMTIYGLFTPDNRMCVHRGGGDD